MERFRIHHQKNSNVRLEGPSRHTLPLLPNGELPLIPNHGSYPQVHLRWFVMVFNGMDDSVGVDTLVES